MQCLIITQDRREVTSRETLVATSFQIKIWHWAHSYRRRSRTRFTGWSRNGTLLSTPTIVSSQLLLPYPQFGGVYSAEPFNRASSYNSLQTKFEKRFTGGGTLLVAYTWAKLITNGDTLTRVVRGRRMRLCCPDPG